MGAESVGQIGLDLVLNRNGFDKQMKGITGLAKKAAGTLAGVFAIRGLVNFGKQCLELGSNLSEVQNVVDVTFRTMSKQVDDFAKSAAMSFGLSETMAKRYSGTFGAMAKAFGFTEKAAYEMGTTLTGLAGDVASFYNITQDEAYTKLKSVFTGETESLKDLGVVMTQAALDQFALANGFGKTTKAMTEQEKVALRFAFVQKQLALASGDFSRTSDSWANQTRILKLQFDSLKASIGQGFINILTPVIKVLNTIMGKLVQLANAFKSFTEMITGKKSESPGANIAESMEVANTGAEGVADETGTAAKNAKKIRKELASFDDVNILRKDDGAVDIGQIGGGASFDNIDFGKAIEDQESIANTALESFKNKFKEVANCFKEGFKVGLGDDFENSLKRIKEHILSIGESLKGIFASEEVVNSAKKFSDSFVKCLGNTIGAIFNIGATIGENLVGGFDSFLKNSSSFIKERITDIFTIKADTLDIVSNLEVALADILSVLKGDTAKQITGSLISIFADGFLGVGSIFARLGRDIVNLITQPIIDNKDKLKQALENFLSPVNTVLSTVSQGVRDTLSKAIEVYDQYLKPLFDSLSKGISDTFGKLLDAYNKYVAPVLDYLSEKFSKVWESSIQPALNSFLELIGKVAGAVQAFWENNLKPCIDWIIATLVPIVAPIFEFLADRVMNAIGSIISIVGNLMDILGGIIDFVVGVFTLDWEKAWNGVKEIFGGVWELICDNLGNTWEQIKTLVRGSINIVKGIITGVLEAIRLNFERVWNGIKSIVDFAINGVKTIITDVLSGIKSGISNALDTIKTTFSDTFNSIKDTVTNVFSSMWNVLKGIINSIIGGIEGMANSVIKGINFVVGALNNLSFDIPEWVPKFGGKSLGFNIPELGAIKIPKLAQGGYVKANQPQLAMIGDNKTQGEIVAPEGKMMEVMIQALQAFFSQMESRQSNNNNAGDGDLTVELVMDDNKMGDVIIKSFRKIEKQTGKVILDF